MTSIRLPTTAERATRITLPRAKDLDWILKSAQRGELPNKLLEQEVPMTELQRTIVRREKPQATDTFAVRLILKYLGPPSGNALDDLEADYEVIYLPSEGGEPIVLEAFRPNIPTPSSVCASTWI